jgi:hypothetical protein
MKLKIPLSYNNLDIHLVDNCEILIEIYLKNQFLSLPKYEIESIHLEYSEFIIIQADILIQGELEANTFDKPAHTEYTRQANIASISIQQNGIGFADQAQFKILKQK